MKLQYLGTSAAEGVPALFCTCDMCRYARQHGGKEIRTRPGALIDDMLKLDFGPDSYLQLLRHGLDYTALQAVLITHTHGDHLNTTDLGYRRATFVKTPQDLPPLPVYGNGALEGKLERYLKISNALDYHQLHAFEPVDIAGYRVTPLEAVHWITHEEGAGFPVVFEGKTYYRDEETLIYLIEKDGESILYAHDSDEFTPRVMDYLAGKRIRIISLDCTNADRQFTYVGHMGSDDNLRLREKLLACGAADEHTVFVASHFSHQNLLPYEQMQQRMPGFIIAYDGLVVDTRLGVLA